LPDERRLWNQYGVKNASWSKYSGVKKRRSGGGEGGVAKKCLGECLEETGGTPSRTLKTGILY